MAKPKNQKRQPLKPLATKLLAELRARYPGIKRWAIREPTGPIKRLTVAEARAFMKRWAVEQNEIHAARTFLRDFGREAFDWLAAQRPAGEWHKLSSEEQDRVLLQFSKDARYRQGKRRSGETRKVVEYDYVDVLASFDRQCHLFNSGTACARFIAKSGETFRHCRSGEKRPVSGNTIITYLNNRRDGIAMKKAERRTTM